MEEKKYKKMEVKERVFESDEKKKNQFMELKSDQGNMLKIKGKELEKKKKGKTKRNIEAGRGVRTKEHRKTGKADVRRNVGL